MISVIFAQNGQGAIGYKGPHLLPWNYRVDLMNFAKLTKGAALVMGNDTFKTLNGPLPGRQHYVVTRSRVLQQGGVQYLPSLSEAICSALDDDPDRDVFVIGGGALIDEAIPMADTIYRTVVLNTLLDDTRPLAKVSLPDAGHTWRGFTLKQSVRSSEEPNLIFETHKRENYEVNRTHYRSGRLYD